MDKEKLNKAAEEYSGDVFNSYPEDVVSDNTLEYECNKAFRNGTDWLMQQPLSERLSEAERESIAFAYKASVRLIQETEITNPNLAEVFKGQQQMLIAIFGADLFK